MTVLSMTHITGDRRTEFFDFKVPSVGQWVNGCKACFVSYGGRLGTGLGQRYVKQDGKFIKVGG